jgi:hypothetical protein
VKLAGDPLAPDCCLSGGDRQDQDQKGSDHLNALREDRSSA